MENMDKALLYFGMLAATDNKDEEGNHTIGDEEFYLNLHVRCWYILRRYTTLSWIYFEIFTFF